MLGLPLYICVRNGASLASDHGLHTPLIVSVSNNHGDIVHKLLSAGTDIDGVSLTHTYMSPLC